MPIRYMSFSAERYAAASVLADLLRTVLILLFVRTAGAACRVRPSVLITRSPLCRRPRTNYSDNQ
jgi:hypothetical protein